MMTGPRTSPGKDSARTAREKRLAEALRANLKRRKSAVRSKASGQSNDTDRPAPGKAGGSGEEPG
jgi:hypothetical protein